MMTKLRVHFDGKVLVPDEPVDLPVGCTLEVQVAPVAAPDDQERPLLKLAKLFEQMADAPDAPTDGAAQHDHYLYGTPKQP